jgi:hypothetical protein
MREQPGYYPGFSTLKQQAFWDEATRKVVLDRVHKVPEMRFFDEEQSRCLETVFDHLLPQSDRTPERRIPILPQVDQRLNSGRIDGYRFEKMPPDRDAYRLGVEAINGLAQELHGKVFAELEPLQRDELLRSIHDGKPGGDAARWERLPTHYFWAMLMQDAVDAYYAHPWAWDEVGFGGPAYPRAYIRLEQGRPEPWEVHEKRYEWTAPSDSVSDRYEPVGGIEEHGGPAGQGGSH